ncbi:hypothetical protein [Streptomyces goshikiensis]|uniref:hypothetical protein n=1 Tax=Streptomyces goshikiensis TaxID=1942 RepID=UPI00332C0ABA
MVKPLVDATALSRSGCGICWIAGEGDGPLIVASASVDGPAAEGIIARARQLREDYGNITGYALDEGPTASRGIDGLGDVLKVFRANEEQLFYKRTAARLAESRLDVCGEWTITSVAQAPKP